MKLAFSTLGCPGWSWDEIFATAKDLGYNGIEIRGVGDEIFAPNALPFKDANIAQTAAQLAKANLKIPMLTTGICLSAGDEDKTIKESSQYIELAGKLKVQYIRLMATGTPQPSEQPDIEKTARLYSRICGMAAEKGVSPLLETNGHFADSALMADFMKKISNDNAGVLWDIHHPFRYYGEAPQKTVKNLGSLIKYVHVKDSVKNEGNIAYRMMGYGDVPVLDALRELKCSGFDGFVSLEWVKRWNPDLSEPGIVFPHFINYMQVLFGQL